ncbi:GNAT family N-acetyltransferase [Dactylosporangium matsuzakiense]|nr:GNAT family N-acetyltransferase [Dactylosporangium matsuzakiense]UWZ48791.1 GNAT family N-acetyltransferase [Dactylosporangium matsuzakiense]
MRDGSMLERVRRVWTGMAAAPVHFTDAAVTVVVSPASHLSPPGWVGIVTIGDAAIATAPDEHTAGAVRRALGGLPVTAVTDPQLIGARLPLAGVLGPATLAYCDAARFRPIAGATAADPADLRPLLDRVPGDEAAEAGLDAITSPAFVVRDGPAVVAAAGYEIWPGGVAHLSVLTDPAHRGRGLARTVAAAAVTAALDAALLPQWRARPEPSRRVARALGFQELGAQLSIDHSTATTSLPRR